jgi:hypothetical protein
MTTIVRLQNSISLPLPRPSSQNRAEPEWSSFPGKLEET